MTNDSFGTNENGTAQQHGPVINVLLNSKQFGRRSFINEANIKIYNAYSVL